MDRAHRRVAAGLAVALLACLAAGREDTDGGEPEAHQQRDEQVGVAPLVVA